VTNLFARMAGLRREGRAFALATVVRTQGSTPQVVGAKLVLADGDDRPAGTLGGGCVEADAILAAHDVLAGKGPSLRAYELTEGLAWNTGLVCGGTMWILAEPGEAAFVSDERSMLADLDGAAAGGQPVAMVTLLEREGRAVRYAGRVFVGTDGIVVGTLGRDTLDARASASALRQLEHGVARLVPIDDTHDLLIDPVAGKPRLVVAGGGHVALAIAQQALLLGFDVTIVEDRPDFADPARFGGATVLHGDIPETLASLHYGWTSFIVIATRGHKLDGACVREAVKTDARYIGLLGSRRKTVLIEEMLREAGVADERIKAIRAPVGLDLGGSTPAEIALSVLAEITQERYRATGRPLRAARQQTLTPDG
jgi:xanthine dehydrogenase accessory factor